MRINRNTNPWYDMSAMHEICTVRMVGLAGAGGAGKGHAAKNLFPKLGIDFSVQSISKRLEQSDLPDEEIENMEQGRRVSDPCIHRLLFEIIEEHRDLEGNNSLLVIDGFPRSPDQADFMFRNFCKEFTSLVVVNANKETCKKACLGRRGRNDDREEIFEQRWNDWENNIFPAIQRITEDFPTYWIPGGKHIPDEIKLNPLIRMVQKMGFVPQIEEFNLEDLFPKEAISSWIAYGELCLMEEILEVQEEEELLVNV